MSPGFTPPLTQGSDHSSISLPITPEGVRGHPQLSVSTTLDNQSSEFTSPSALAPSSSTGISPLLQRSLRLLGNAGEDASPNPTRKATVEGDASVGYYTSKDQRLFYPAENKDEHLDRLDPDFHLIGFNQGHGQPADPESSGDVLTGELNSASQADPGYPHYPSITVTGPGYGSQWSSHWGNYTTDDSVSPSSGGTLFPPPLGGDIHNDTPPSHCTHSTHYASSAPTTPIIKKFTGASAAHLVVSESNRKREKKYTCEICRNGFTSNQNLKNHMNSHLGVNPYPCPHCRKPYRHARSRNRHLKRAHSTSHIPTLKEQRSPQV